LNRAQLKSAAEAILDRLADEHPLGHQASKAGRYVLRTTGGSSIELMIEKNDTAPLNLWVERRHAEAFVGGAISCKPSPASSLRRTIGKDGRPNYGRHSALERMPVLGEADLLCIAPRSLEELGKLLDHLMEQ
jgi:hypothetical protein